MAQASSGQAMPAVRIGFTAFHGEFDTQHNPITDLLRRRFEVQVCDDPDFMFCADFWYGAHRFDLNKLECVRIGYTGENDNADFSSFDYYIGFEHITYPDRYFRCPNCKQKVRVPKGKGTIEIRCPKCNTKFIKRT